MAGYIGSKAVNLSTTGADINGNANVDGTLDVTGATTVTGAFTSLGIDDNAAATAVTIDASGQVGIGTASPSVPLTVQKGAAGDVCASFKNAGFFGMKITPQVGGSGATTEIGLGGGESLSFAPNNTEAMRIDSSGNVGIGTAVPLSNLHIEDVGNTVSQRIFTSDNVSNAKASILFGTTPGARTKAAVEMVNSSTGNAAGTLTLSTNNGTTLTERMRIDSSGNVLVGTTVANGLLVVAGNGGGYTTYLNGGTGGQNIAVRGSGTTGTCFRVLNGSGSDVGSIDYTASATTYNTTSDYRLKENVEPIQGAADIVKAMQPVTYTYKVDGSWMDGFLAHELQELHPRAVTGSKDAMVDEEYEVTPAVEATYDAEGNELTPAVPAVMGTRSVPDYQGVDYSKLTPILTAALQEALNKIDALEARLTALEATP